MPERLLKLGSFGCELSIFYPKVRRNFLDGLDGDDPATTSVRRYRLVYKALPNATLQNVLDPEDDVTRTEAQYLEAFWRRRIQDGAAFTITDFRTGEDVTVKFLPQSDALSLTLFRRSLFESELYMEEYEA
jgi:hypothetical protein